MSNDNDMSRRKFLTASAGATVGAAAALGAPAVIASRNSKVKWRMQTHWPRGTWYYDDVFQKFAERVTEATDGELEIEPHAPGSVVSTGDTLRAVARGTLDSAFTWPSYWIGDIPVAGHLNGNLATFGNHEEMHLFFYHMGALDIIREAYAERGVYQLGPSSTAGIAIYANKAIRTPEDFRGFNIRSTGTAARVFEKMGAAPVAIDGGELYSALETGVVDGVHWGGVAAGWGMNLQEVNDYIMQPDLVAHTNGEAIINMDRWNELGSDHKQALDTALRATSIDSSSHFRYHDFQRMQDFVNDYDGEIIQMEDSVIEQMREHSMAVVDEVSEQDPEYSGKVGDLLHEFMELTGKL
ncbi:TRAP transporter substrate-binding protein [Aquisalimonas sp.]|uniref:TRAP transporter substrate-binding protein n=1 Tax=Aquisalimonas sp. TaxID=1872621 RepID=UPI0025BED97F|nr:TRAP transporter substrate-binding protein [Aquisalimonas sp.]